MVFSKKIQRNNQPNKQTKKQKTNKTFFISTIYQLNQVQYLQNFQEIFPGVSQDDSNKKQTYQ